MRYFKVQFIIHNIEYDKLILVHTMTNVSFTFILENVSVNIIYVYIHFKSKIVKLLKNSCLSFLMFL